MSELDQLFKADSAVCKWNTNMDEALSNKIIATYSSILIYLLTSFI